MSEPRPRTVPYDHSDEWHGRNTNSLQYHTDVYDFERNELEDEPEMLELVIDTLLAKLPETQAFVLRYCIMGNPEALYPAPPPGVRDERFHKREAARLLGVTHDKVSRDLVLALDFMARELTGTPWLKAMLSHRVQFDPEPVVVPTQRTPLDRLQTLVEE